MRIPLLAGLLSVALCWTLAARADGIDEPQPERQQLPAVETDDIGEADSVGSNRELYEREEIVTRQERFERYESGRGICIIRRVAPDWYFIIIKGPDGRRFLDKGQWGYIEAALNNNYVDICVEVRFWHGRPWRPVFPPATLPLPPPWVPGPRW